MVADPGWSLRKKKPDLDPTVKKKPDPTKFNSATLEKNHKNTFICFFNLLYKTINGLGTTFITDQIYI